MSRQVFALLSLFAVCCFAGCGGADDGSATEGAPPAVESGTSDYDQYSGAGRKGPGEGGHGAAKK